MGNPLHIEDVEKYYGEFKAIDKVSSVIGGGEFFTLLGPSGCGKTTLLRMIAGFNSIDGGVIKFKDNVINNIPAYKRNIGMVFQNYAIFPHMSVFDNIAYGLKARKLSKTEIEDSVLDVLKLVKMEEYKDRQPSKLSGGQQQRIALARAIVINPDILLMDEPLSNLDAKLRIEMREVIKKIQNSLNITTIYVTHDQEEALAISDRIAVMDGGRIQQVGTPRDIYMNPINRFVADFIGTTTFIDCYITSKTEGRSSVLLPGIKEFEMEVKSDYSGDAVFAFRAEDVSLQEPHKDKLNGEVTFATYLGTTIDYEVTMESGKTIFVSENIKDNDTQRDIGDNVSLSFNLKRINIFDGSGKDSLQ